MLQDDIMVMFLVFFGTNQMKLLRKVLFENLDVCLLASKPTWKKIPNVPPIEFVDYMS